MIIFLSSIFYLLFSVAAYAISPTPTDSSPTPDIINQLKDRIASRVAQLKLVERRGIIGIVEAVSNTQISVMDLHGNIRFIDVDELTKFSSQKNSDSFGISDITKGTIISALGLYNKDSKRLLSRFTNVVDLPLFIHGTIASLDKENYAFDVNYEKKKKITVDVENTTKTYTYTKDTDLVRSGFSKLAENEKVFVVGVKNLKNPDRVIGLRVIRFPEIKTEVSATPSPSSPSPTISEKKKK